jgi:hypothetical protein
VCTRTSEDWLCKAHRGQLQSAVAGAACGSAVAHVQGGGHATGRRGDERQRVSERVQPRDSECNASNSLYISCQLVR